MNILKDNIPSFVCNSADAGRALSGSSSFSSATTIAAQSHRYYSTIAFECYCYWYFSYGIEESDLLSLLNVFRAAENSNFSV
jgi:hypothetical protein